MLIRFFMFSSISPKIDDAVLMLCKMKSGKKSWLWLQLIWKHWGNYSVGGQVALNLVRYIILIAYSMLIDTYWMVTWFLLVRQINSDPYSVYLSSVWEGRKTNSLPPVSKSLFLPSQVKLNSLFYLLSLPQLGTEGEKAFSRSIFWKASPTLMLCCVFIYLLVWQLMIPQMVGFLNDPLCRASLNIGRFVLVFGGVDSSWMSAWTCTHLIWAFSVMLQAPHYQADAAGINYFIY